METTICVNVRGQGQVLAPEESSESEMYPNPPNSRGGITVTPTPAWGGGGVRLPQEVPVLCF